MLLLVYGAVGVYMDDLYVRGKRGRGSHLHGPPAWIMYGAFACGALTLLSLVMDHYDQRNNERHYRAFAQWMRIIGWLLFFVAILADLLVYHRASR